MKHIICGTNRPESRSLEICKILQSLYTEHDSETPEIINLEELDLSQLQNSHYGEAEKPASIKTAIEKINNSDGLIMVAPEYNGSYPGALKYFIDQWSYPESFEKRAICFVGLGGQFGALRPVEHLQGVFGYRNAFIFPERVFITNVWNILKNGTLEDDTTNDLLVSQTQGFIKFVKALKDAGLSR